MSRRDDKVLKQLQARYRKANSQERGAILDEFVRTTAYHQAVRGQPGYEGSTACWSSSCTWEAAWVSPSPVHGSRIRFPFAPGRTGQRPSRASVRSPSWIIKACPPCQEHTASAMAGAFSSV